MKITNKKVVTDKATKTQKNRIFALAKTLCLNFNDDYVRHSFIETWTYGRASGMKDLNFIDAKYVISYLEEMTRKAQENKNLGGTDEDLNPYRRGCMRAIYRWMDLQGKNEAWRNANLENPQEYVKGIICRAAKVKRCHLNEITKATLQRIYQEYCGKQRILMNMKTEEKKKVKYNLN